MKQRRAKLLNTTKTAVAEFFANVKSANHIIFALGLLFLFAGEGCICCRLSCVSHQRRIVEHSILPPLDIACNALEIRPDGELIARGVGKVKATTAGECKDWLYDLAASGDDSFETRL